MKTKPMHYLDVLDALTAYRSAKYLRQTPYNEEYVKRLNMEPEDVKKSYENAEKVVKTVESAVLKMRLKPIDGYILADIIQYRFMDRSPHSEAEIIQKLTFDGVVTSRAGYQRLKEKALILMCSYMWGDDITPGTFQDINTPA